MNKTDIKQILIVVFTSTLFCSIAIIVVGMFMQRLDEDARQFDRTLDFHIQESKRDGILKCQEMAVTAGDNWEYGNCLKDAGLLKTEYSAT